MCIDANNNRKPASNPPEFLQITLKKIYCTLRGERALTHFFSRQPVCFASLPVRHPIFGMVMFYHGGLAEKVFPVRRIDIQMPLIAERAAEHLIWQIKNPNATRPVGPSSPMAQRAMLL